jgi:diguanylate cyclase (GGDEF)-like protein
VLVVDDEPTIRGVIAQVLRLDGHDATEVGSAEEALVAFRANPYPIVITDIIMAGMSGLELLREIKAMDRGTLVVIMTSQASLEAATTALRGGAYDFLVKPFDDLIMISAVVERASQRLALQARNQLLTNQLQMYARELERLNASLKDMADRDWLTGLPNRRRLHGAVDGEIARATRNECEFSLVMLDVDRFKAYNDRYGHLAGDEVLRRVAKVLQVGIRGQDLCARYGGEEFAVLLPETNLVAARGRAEEIRCLIEEHPFEGAETQPGGKITASLGVACFPMDGPDGDTLLGRADAALYRAKELGRNRVEG